MKFTPSQTKCLEFFRASGEWMDYRCMERNRISPASVAVLEGLGLLEHRELETATYPIRQWRAAVLPTTPKPAVAGSHTHTESDPMNHDDTSHGAPDPLTTEESAELANVLPASPEEAYAEGRADQLAADLHLLAWAYRKLDRFTFSKQEDALVMDQIKLMLMGAD